MKVPYLDLRITDEKLRSRLLKRLEIILRHGILVSGPEQTEFEIKFAKEIGMKYALGVSSGSSALYLSLLALGIGNGDEVITTPYTWIITTNAIAAVGAIPIFVDVRDDFNIDPDAIDKAVTSKTKAILPMHVAGHMCDMKKISEIAKKNNLLIVEDASQAFCSALRGKRAGTFSEAAAFSLNPMKVLHAYGEAGVVVTNNKKVYEKLKQLRHAGTKRYENKNNQINRCNYLALNHKIDTIQASFLIEELNRISHIKDKRDKIAKYYDSKLPEIGCVPQQINNGEIHGRYFYIFTCKKRDSLSKHLLNKSIENKIFYSPLTCDAPIYRNHIKPELPVARRLLKKSIAIPMHENMSIEQAKYVVEEIKSFYK